MKVGDWVRPRVEVFSLNPSKSNWGAGVIEEVLSDGRVKVRYASNTSDMNYGYRAHRRDVLVLTDKFGSPL